MGFHTFPIERAGMLDDVGRYRYLSRDELVAFIEPTGGDRIVDLGSGTGFFTDEVAPFVDRVYAVDVQKAMHDRYRKKGHPENVTLVTAEIEGLPLVDESLDAAITTMTYHEFFSPSALAEVRRVLRPAGRFVIVDWSRDGEGEHGPPLAERCTLSMAGDHCRAAGFSIEHGRERPETFVLVATR